MLKSQTPGTLDHSMVNSTKWGWKVLDSGKGKHLPVGLGETEVKNAL